MLSGPCPSEMRAAAADRHLSVNAAVLRYRDEGCGPAVLLIHGWTMDIEVWEPQVAELTDSFRLVRFDRRGFGLSTGDPSLACDAADALSLCDHLGLRRFACLGLSQGARVALRLCEAAPERLSCVILDGPPQLSAASGADEATDIPLTEYRALVDRGDIETFRRRWTRHPLMQLHSGDAHARALLRRMTARYSGKDLLQASCDIETGRDRSALASLRIPALVLGGEHDLPARLRAADELAAALPLARRALIGAAGHLPSLDAPRSYNAVVRDFLQHHAGPRRPENADA